MQDERNALRTKFIPVPHRNPGIVMTNWKVTASTLLLLSLVLLPGILNTVSVNVYGQNFTSLTITLSSSTVPVLTGTVTVSAHLSGETAAALGDTVTYQLFSSASCSPGTIVQSDPQTIQPGLVVPPSTSFTMMSPPLPSSSPAGTFSFNAVYSGDANNRPSTSLCKQITVTKTPTTTTTSITPPLTITAGGSVTDTATLSGTNIFAGTVQFRLYLGASCSGNVLQSNTIPFSGVGPYSDTFTIPNPGTYSLRASYSGDSLDLGSTSPCELGVTVTKQSPTLTTTSIPLLPASITFGGSIVDTASLTGGTSNAGGTVTYNLFSNAGCAGTPVQTSTVTVTNGIVPNSKSFIINSGGSYSLKAVYSGDKNNAGPVSSSCEATLTVGKSTPSITPSFVSPTTIFVGQSLTVSASLSSATFNAGGTVQYDLYSDSCVTFIAAHTVTVSFGHVPNTSFITTLASMSYHVTATYSGDASNAPSGPSGCSAGGTAIVKQLTPSISTQLSTTTVAPFGSVTDSAMLSGTSGNTAGDQVIYTMYSTGNCMGPPVGAPTTVFITNGGGVPSVTLITNAAGSYSFQAVFQGDTNNNQATSTCEPFTVQLFTPSISTQLSATTIVFGGTITDSATLANAGAPAGGSVTYNLYSNGACTGTIVQADTETVTNGVVPSTHTPLTPNSGGTFGVQAVYNGDGVRNNPSAPSSCEVLTVNQVSTQISTKLTPTTILVGSTATDTAILTGFAPNAGGTVTFSLYAGSTCSGTVIYTSSGIPVTNGVPVHSFTTRTFQAGSGGPYSISAVYSGDPNNAGATSACNELLSVQETPTLSTVLSAGTIEALQPVTDSATLSGATSQNHWPAGGTVTYALYTGGSCSNVALDTSPVTVANGVVPSTTFPGTDFNTPGPYSIKARYSGDSYNTAASATCESFTVTPATSSISTQLSASSPIFTDESITDLATLSGVTANAGGSVTYSLYPNGVCLGSIATDTENVVNDVVPTSTPFHVHNSGTFSVQATYSPDANNSPATSSCEVFTAVLHSPTISTQLSATSISFGGTITDSATLANAGATAGGSVTYNLYSNGACTGTIVQTDTETVTNGIVLTSNPLTPNSGGTFGVEAVYNGDANNNGQTSSCEAFTVSPLSLTTQLSATVVPTAGSISDSATLSGATSNAGGTVTYTLYAGPTCSGAVQGSSAALTVTNGVVPNSGVFQLSNLSPATGSFSFQAVYSGDANNKGVTSTCEPFSVVKASPSISTQLSATTITAGGSVTDTATLMGATSNAGNIVTYTMYAGSSCSGTILGKYIETLTNGFVPTSGVFTANSAGTYSFQAVYSGDTGNNGASSACEILIATAQKSSPTISTQLSTTSITVFGSVTDKATLTGATSNAGGTVTFTMYNGGSCSGGSVGSDTETVTNGVVPTSSAFGTSAVGLNSFQAVYSGDTNNNGATSPCEVLTVNPASPTISIILSSNTILHGGSVTISSGLIGATSNAGGTVTITMYIGGTCSGSVVGSPDALTVTNGVVPMSSPFFANTAGTYSLQAVYGGDANNMAASSACTILTST